MLYEVITHNIRAQSQRSLEKRRRKGIVHNQGDIPRFGSPGPKAYINDIHRGIGRGFDIEKTGFSINQLFHLRQVAASGRRKKPGLDTEFFQVIGKQGVGSAVNRCTGFV